MAQTLQHRPERTRPDRCPGIERPWKADDGLLVRIRLVAGHLAVADLRALARAAEAFGDGRIHLTNRANLQLRAFPDDGTGHLTEESHRAVVASGLMPSPRHDLVRNVMASPLTGIDTAGIDGGRADLTGLAMALDEGIRASESLATLPGKFLFVLDDGRGDLLQHPCDLGLVVLDATTAQLRIGDDLGEVVALDDAARVLLELAERFVAVRGDGPDAPWHVNEMDAPLAPLAEADPRLPQPSEPLPFGESEDGRWNHMGIGPEGIEAAQLVELLGAYREVRVTPWYGVLVWDGAAGKEARA